jgi:site-specific recombinase XerD
MNSLVPVIGFPAWPVAVANASPKAQYAILQFFAAEIDNARTRRAYLKGAEDFFACVAPSPGGDRLETLTSLHVAAWMADMKWRGLSVPTQKLRLAGLRMLFQALVREQVLGVNPAGAVKGPKHSAGHGKTPVLTGEEMLDLLNSIDTDALIGLRDRALIGAMAYSFARVGAVITLKVEDVFHQKRRLWLRLHEKGGKRLEIPCHHQFENYLVDWLERSGLKDRPAAPLFQSFTRAAGGGERVPSGRALTQAMVWEMVQRRAKAAGLKTAVCNHTFRATGITAYLSNGGTIERAANIAGHASTRTTQLYDRRSDEVTLEEVEKIRFA